MAALALFPGLAQVAFVQALEVKLARPTAQQFAWQEQERIMFVCLDPCTWQGREYDNHSTPLSAINPAQLDTDQWCRAAQLWGAKEILFVAKHTGGFCWWQTETSQYGVKQIPWRGGKGDVVKDLAQSCRRRGLKLGIYLSPADDQFGAGGGGRCKTSEAQTAYNQVYRQQLTELLSRYGEVFEVWFDGSCVIDIGDLLKQCCPKSMVFQGPQATIRWPGTESGKLPYPAWNSLKLPDLGSGVATAAHGDPDGDAWAPLEADTTLYDHNWFWAAENERKRKTLNQLMEIYYESAGHGGVLLLNSTPNTNGLIPEGDLKLYQAFGKEIERRFSRPLVEVKNQQGACIELALPRPTAVNHIVIMEDYGEGERIREYTVEGLSDGQWKKLSEGTSVGRQKIDRFPSAQVSRMRLTVTRFAAEPRLRRVAVFRVEGEGTGNAQIDGLPVQETKETKATPNPAQPVAKTLERVTLAVDRKVLNPLREKKASTKLTVTGIYPDGSQRTLSPAEVEIRTRTKNASGNVEVVTIQGGTAVAKEGGIATIEATVVQGGRRVKGTADAVVAPFYRDYHQTLVLKLFLGMEGEPVERLLNEPLFQRKHDVLCTFAEALEVIRKTDNLTRGIPKIVYLVGWQKGGHDHGYPAWSEVNPRLKREQDPDALESLRWLIREARKFHTTVSLHLNMVDAYKQSPLWDEYVARDCLARDLNGQLLVAGIQMKGEEMYNVVYPKEWAAGLAQRRIDGLIRMIPELKAGHTIHVDVFIAQREGGAPISPWHAKPDNGGLTPDKYVETQRKIFHYWRERGFDVTGEGIFWAHPPGEGFTGLQAMSWWYPNDVNYQMQIPECLMARGRTDRGGDGDFRFGSSMHGEEIFQKDKEGLPGFLGMFCRTTLPWYYLSRLERQTFENGALHYSGGVVARNENGANITRKGDFVLRENDNLFVPALWQKKEIIAHSSSGYANKAWRMPDDWSKTRKVDLYRITPEGCVLREKEVSLAGPNLILSLGKDESLSIVPSGAKLDGRAPK